MKKELRPLLLIAIGIICLWIIGTIFSKREREESDNYYKNFDIMFSGIVIEKELINYDWGLITIDLRTSSVEYYDVRDSLARYYCVIRNGKAEIIQYPFSGIQLGDSVSINGKLQEFKLYRNGVLVIETQLPHLTGNDSDYEKAKELHKL